jgi:Domain of unknown function (DUF4276)
MTSIACIVEGDGEVAALPVLLRRIGALHTPDQWVDVLPPIRVRRDRFLNKEDEFRRQLLLASSKCGASGWILVLLDADDDCPAELGARILERSRQVVAHHRISVVLANREYESWFVAAANSLNGHRGFTHDGHDEPDPDRPRDAKGWIKRRMAGRSYSEITDQPAMSALLDLNLAFARSRSFRKLCSEWLRQMNPS